MTLQLDHKYRVGAVVHRGAMATTYRATWELFDLPVFIRSYETLARLRLRHRDATRIRWAVETEAGKIRGPHLPDVIDAGFEEATKPFLVMRLPDGDLLLNRLRSSGRLDAPEVARIVRAVAEALDRCREVGVPHRGPTADRVWVGDDGEVFLLGVGEVLYRDDTVSMAGAPTTELLWHIPPESFTVSLRRTDTTEDDNSTLRLRTKPSGTLQGRQLEDDPRAEVYALGCLAYHALNSHHPFFTALDEPTEGIHATIRDTPLPLRDHSQASEVWHVLSTAIARDPSSRYASVADFAARFSAAVEAETRPRRPILDDDRTGAKPLVASEPSEGISRPQRSSEPFEVATTDPFSLWAWRFTSAVLFCVVVGLLLRERLLGTTVLVTSTPAGLELGEQVGHERAYLGRTPLVLSRRDVADTVRLFTIGPDGSYGATAEHAIRDFARLGVCRVVDLELAYPESGDVAGEASGEAPPAAGLEAGPGAAAPTAEPSAAEPSGGGPSASAPPAAPATAPPPTALPAADAPAPGAPSPPPGIPAEPAGDTVAPGL